MAKDRKKLQHIHSSIPDKQPTAASLEVGEIAVNNAQNQEFLSIKNSSNEVVRFSSDEQIVTWMERKEAMPYSGIVDNVHLDTNRSNIEIKFNQVIANNTVKHNIVNGARDIDGDLVNPTDDGGLTNGAGFAIDMSQYAMIGANPSFSSVTTTCGATLKGTTEIKGVDGDCGSRLNVDVDNVCVDATDTLNEYGANNSNFGSSCNGTNVSKNTTLKGDEIHIEAENDPSTIDIKACSHISGLTNEFVINECVEGDGSIKLSSTDIDISAKTINEKACTRINENTDSFNVTECNEGQGTTVITSCKGVSALTNNFIVKQCGDSGITNIKSCAEIKLESKNIDLTDGECGDGQITIDTNDLCLVGREKINVYGDETNLGLDCTDDTVATNNNIYGKDILVSATTGSIIESALIGNIENSAETILNSASNNICDQALNEATFYGKNETNIGINCEGDDRSTITNVSGDTLNEGGNIVNIDAESNINETADGNIIESATAGTISEIANNITETASVDITNTAANDINLTASKKLCEKGEDAYFYGTKTTHIGVGCDGNKSTDEIIYERIPDGSACGISAATVDDALHEVYNRSIISLTSTAHTSSTSSQNSSYTEYEIHQDIDGCERTTAFTVNDTIVAMSAETQPAASELAKKYTLWQYVGDNKVTIGEIDIPKDHILKDVSIVNGKLNGSTFTPCSGTGDTGCTWFIKLVWNVFDPSTGHADDKTVYIPADDLVNDYVFDDSSAIGFKKTYDGKQYHVSADTTVKIVSPNGDKIFSKSNAVHSLNSYQLSTREGAYSATTNTIFDPLNTNATINIPTDASHIKNRSVSWSYGDVKNAQSGTYAPSQTNNGSFVIPKCVNDLNRRSLDLTYGDVRNMSGTVAYDPGNSACSGKDTVTIPTSTSHLNKSALTATYGKTSDKSGSVIYNTEEAKDITIPTDASHIGNRSVSWSYGDVTTAQSGTYAPSQTNNGSFKIPSDASHITRKTVSATHNGTTYTYDPGASSNQTWTLSHNALTIDYGVDVKTAQDTTYDTSAARTISIPTDASHIANRKVSWSYGNVQNASGSNYTPSQSSDGSFVIPKCVNDLNRRTLNLNYGDVKSMSGTVAYDPGNPNCSGSDSVAIPNSLDHLTQYNGTCYIFNHDICMSANTVTAKAFYAPSDFKLKDKISFLSDDELNKASNVALKSFVFKSDEEKRKMYGVIAQEVQSAGLDNIVHKNEQGELSVDYTSLLILKIANLEKMVDELTKKVEVLENNVFLNN